MNRMASIGVGGVVAAGLALSIAPSTLAQHSVARDWNDTMLESIKRDRVRPPVQARNLFHMSVAMYDAWAAYDASLQPYFFTEKIAAKNIEAARHESISYAAYRLMKHRFALSTANICFKAVGWSSAARACCSTCLHRLCSLASGERQR